MRNTGPRFCSVLLIACSQALAGCSSFEKDYSDLATYYERKPRTILVLPVSNNTLDAEAPWLFLATISKPLINRGYYVYPTEVTAEILAREGIYEAADAWQVPPAKLLEYLGADAALYVTLEGWDSSYSVLTSKVTVTVSFRLVECRSGAELWTQRVTKTVKSDGSDFGVIGLLIDAAATAAFTDHLEIASQANDSALASLPVGDDHPEYPQLQEKIARWKEKHAR